MDPQKRNLQEKFWGWTNELIRSELEKNGLGYAVLAEHWLGDFNISTLIRNANAFRTSKVFYLGGKKKIDPRGAVGMNHYTNLTFLKDHSELLELKKQYTFVAMENNVPNCAPLKGFKWPKNALMIFGEEGSGITKETLELADLIVYIQQGGCVRSLNVGTASGIAMNSYMEQYGY